LGYSFVTSLGDSAYYLLMGDGVHLWKQVANKDPEDLGDLEGFFPSWKKSPTLPAFVGRDDYTLVMETVERSSMPTGLYGLQELGSKTHQDGLYLVSREWHPRESRTQWLLSKIQFQDGRVVGVVKSSLPSGAKHLFAIPGLSRWAFVEKGPAVGLREQSTKGFFTVPAERVAKAFDPSSLNGNGQFPRDLCP